MKDYVIGIDIGGTFTKTGIVDREGNIFAEHSSRTDNVDSVDVYLYNLVKKLQKSELELEKPYKIIGIGIGAPSGNYHKGTIEQATNLKWKGIVPFADMMKEHYNVPVLLTNDANAAALGEKVYGGGKDLNDFVMITLGTGLGSGLIVNGELVYGHDGFGGELGHVNAIENGRQCGCGNKGCLETYVSAPGLKRSVFELLAANNQGSELVNYTFDNLDSEIIYNAAVKGDPVALEAFEQTGKTLGKKLADIVALISPEAIFFFGGLIKAGDFILKPTKMWMEHYLMGIFKNKVKLYPSKLMDKNVAVLGASALIWNKLDR